MLNLDDIQPRVMEFRLCGETYAVPTLDALEADPVLSLIEDGNVDRADIINLFRSVLDKHAKGAVEHMTLAQLHALLAEWQRTGDAGESSPSSD